MSHSAIWASVVPAHPRAPLVEGLMPRKGGATPTPRKYPNKLYERAQGMVAEAISQNPTLSLNGAVARIGLWVGVAPDTLRG